MDSHRFHRPMSEASTGGSIDSTPQLTLHPVIIVFLITLAALITCSNMIVIATAIYDRRLHRLQYLPLVSLSAADLLMVVPIVLLVSANFYTKNKPFIHAVFTFSAFSYIASMLNLVAVCIERWVAIFKPLRYGAFLKNRNIIGIVSSAWLMAVVFAFGVSF